ncbi:radical SAM protein [Candidatus Woesearchaeota archaeon]|nr:radical SAM protein [Candidatus Woesearchaeota archaeon]
MRILSKIKLGLGLAFRFKFKEAINFIKAYITIKKEPLIVKSKPVLVQIEATNRCNLKCIMCAVNYERKDQKKNDLTINKFKNILQQFPYVKSLILNGSGEPLLNKDIFQIIEKPIKKNVLVGFHTNGLLLTKDIAEKIIASDLSWLNISIDSHKKETYEQIRKGSDYEKVIANIKYLTYLIKKTNSKLELTLVIVIMNHNLKELPDYIKFFGSIGVENIKAQRVHIMDEYPEKKKKFVVKNKELSKKMHIKAIEEAKKNGVNLTFTTFYTEEKKEKGCNWPWLGPFIDVNGEVMPCCVINTPDILSFGNIFKEDFSKIWNNKKYQDFRKELRSKKKPALCKKMKCPYYTISLLDN